MRISSVRCVSYGYLMRIFVIAELSKESCAKAITVNLMKIRSSQEKLM